MQDQDPTHPASGAEQSTSPETRTTLNPYEGWSLDLSKCSPHSGYGAAVIRNAVGRQLLPGPTDDWMAAGAYLRYLNDSALRIVWGQPISGFTIWEHWSMREVRPPFWTNGGRAKNHKIWESFKPQPVVEMTLSTDLSAAGIVLDAVTSEVEAVSAARKFQAQTLCDALDIPFDPNQMSIKDLISFGALTPNHAAVKLSTHPALIPAENIEFAPVVAGELLDYVQAFAAMQRIVYGLNKHAGWWSDLDTGEPKERNDGELICLMHSELSEALEAHRKNLMDDKLPHRKGVEVELADTVIRILDYCGGRGLDLAGALIEKLAYNAVREDHTPEARRGANGKKI